MAHGTLISLHLKDFLTYTDFYLSFEPGLNVIYGPNGTGKSSILCAILIVLGGNPKNLNRSKSLFDYVRHNQPEAEIEVQINSNTGKVAIKRRIFREGRRRSDWFINGRPSCEREVLEFTRTLQIALDNLCNFLPQDRVTDFFRMTQQQLLVALEEAVDNDLRVSHQQLSKIYEDKSEKLTSAETRKRELERLQQRQQSMEEDVKKFEEMKSNQKHMHNLELKICWSVLAL